MIRYHKTADSAKFKEKPKKVSLFSWIRYFAKLKFSEIQVRGFIGHTPVRRYNYHFDKHLNRSCVAAMYL